MNAYLKKYIIIHKLYFQHLFQLHYNDSITVLLKISTRKEGIFIASYTGLTKYNKIFLNYLTCTKSNFEIDTLMKDIKVIRHYTGSLLLKCF